MSRSYETNYLVQPPEPAPFGRKKKHVKWPSINQNYSYLRFLLIFEASRLDDHQPIFFCKHFIIYDPEDMCIRQNLIFRKS